MTSQCKAISHSIEIGISHDLFYYLKINFSHWNLAELGFIILFYVENLIDEFTL